MVLLFAYGNWFCWLLLLQVLDQNAPVSKKPDKMETMMGIPVE